MFLLFMFPIQEYENNFICELQFTLIFSMKNNILLKGDF